MVDGSKSVGPEDSTFQVPQTALSDLSYQKTWTGASAPDNPGELAMGHRCFIVPCFISESGSSTARLMEKRFTESKHELFRSAFQKTSVFMALLTAGVAVWATTQALWLRAALLWGLMLPLYAAYGAISSHRHWKRALRCRRLLVLALCAQSAGSALAEMQRPLPTSGLLLLHTAFVNNFCPLSVLEILLVAVCGVPTKIIIGLLPDWKVTLEQAHCAEQPGATTIFRDILLPPLVCACQFVLAIWRDETMRLDLLLRDQLQMQRNKLKQETRKSEDLLQSMLPQAIIESLKNHEPVECQDWPDVTVIFVQVCDFSRICSVLPPTLTVEVLDKVFQELDRLSDLLKVHKVETVGDVYMAVSGCPQEIANHADVAAHFALAAQSSMIRMRARDLAPQGVKGRRLSMVLSDQNVELRIRIGLNSGPIRAGVVGLDKPRYKLFGDTVNTASRMESTSEPGHTQMTEATRARLSDIFHAEERGEVQVKGKGSLRTFYLQGYSMIDSDTARASEESVTIMVVQKARCDHSPDSVFVPGKGRLRRAAGVLQELVAVMPDTSQDIMSFRTTLTNKSFRWKHWMETKLLMVPSSSKSPEMLLRLRHDKAEYKHETLERHLFFARTLVIAWHLLLASTATLDYAFDIASSDFALYRAGVLVRTWGVQVTGWLHLGLIVDKPRFAKRGRLITGVMLSLEGASIQVLNAMIFNNDPSFYMLYGLYVLFSKTCPFMVRLLICFLCLVAWSVVDNVLCDWEVRQRAAEYVSYTGAVLALTALGIRMQEHLDHCADFYKRHVERQIRDISETRKGSQLLLEKILPSHVVQLVNDGVSPIAEDYTDVSIVFTDMRGFTSFCSRITPAELVELLNTLYSAFDEVILDWGLHKVEVIGDAYFISSGCPVTEDEKAAPDQFAMRAVEVGLALQRVVPTVCDDNSVQMRCGIHSGNVIAGVVGKKGPRYHLFGPSVEFANLMESTGIPTRVQISSATKAWLDCGGHDYDFEERLVEISGEEHKTFLVNRSKSRAARQIRTALAMHRHDQATVTGDKHPRPAKSGSML